MLIKKWHDLPENMKNERVKRTTKYYIIISIV